MTDRKRKKWLKKHGKYVDKKDTWSLDHTIAEFILPRLKLFKKLNNGYPGRGDMDTSEKWDEALDKMILSFEYIVTSDDWWINDPRYDYTDYIFLYKHQSDAKDKGCTLTVSKCAEEIYEAYKVEENRRQACIDEGLELFGKWFQALWW